MTSSNPSVNAFTVFDSDSDLKRQETLFHHGDAGREKKLELRPNCN